MQDGSLVDDAEVRLFRIRTTFAYPVVFSQGKSLLLNELSYQHIGFDYHKTTSLLERLHSISYTLTVLHQVSDKWLLMATGTSSLASDLEVEVSMDDFSFETAIVFSRGFSPGFSAGLGVAYSTQFGSAVPVPLLSLDWNNGGKWSANALLPSSLEIWYAYSHRLDVGLLVTGEGDNFRFDPKSYRDSVPEPELRYTMMTVGLATGVHFSEHVTLGVEVGIIGLHRFEFYSGDEEIVSNDLEPSQYLRLGLRLNL